MGFGIKQITHLTIAVFIGTGLVTACASNSGDTNKAISERKAVMKSISKNNKLIKAYVKDGKGSTADVVKYANALKASSDKIPRLFPNGTGRGDYSDKVTRALPSIWKDWAGFEKANANFAKESEALAQIAATGDKQAIAKQAGVLGKSCGGCHKPFRGKKVK